ncbi:hypothetical protein ACIHCX_11265 [Streptomyces sp. NPDC052043]|uniref:hypothetical protein n=1 Tax=Streptomyces sp. NPDC052043 TaxID=3365684 RepID=UPI0037D59981
MTIIRKALAVGAATVTAGAALALGMAGTVQAASPCWKSGSIWYCDNATGAKVYKSTNTGSVVGRMYSNPSWFVCKFDGGGRTTAARTPPAGSPRRRTTGPGAG